MYVAGLNLFTRLNNKPDKVFSDHAAPSSTPGTLVEVVMSIGIRRLVGGLGHPQEVVAARMQEEVREMVKVVVEIGLVEVES